MALHSCSHLKLLPSILAHGANYLNTLVGPLHIPVQYTVIYANAVHLLCIYVQRFENKSEWTALSLGFRSWLGQQLNPDQFEVKYQ